MSVDRKYFRYGDTVSNNPGFGSAWDLVDPGAFYGLVDDPTDSPMATVTSNANGLAGVKQVAAIGWISQALPNDVRLAGTMAFRMRAREVLATNDAKLALQILVVSGDSATIRGQLFYGLSANELTTTLTATDIQGAMTDVDALAGDKIVTIVGFDISNPASTLLSNQLNVGDTASLSDLTSESQAADRPYIEFTWVDPPFPPENLQTTEVKAREIDVEWDAPSGGSAPTAYEIRINGGSAIDTGLVQTHSFTNVTEDTTHLVEVRTLTGTQYSPWTQLEVKTPILTRVVSWDNPDERFYQTGCDRGAIYFDDGSAVPWNGLTGVDETGTGTASVLYRDGNIYYSDVDPSDFTATVRAFFWPDAFGRCLGIPEITDGLYVDNQKPRKFNFTYRNLVGSGGRGDRFGYQIHLVYNALAVIGTRSRKTRTNQVQLDEFTFDIVATPVKMPGLRPSAHYIIDTRTMDQTTIKQLEDILYSEGRLPEPEELYDLMNFGDSIIFVDHGDGTWTARGSSNNLIDHENGTWTIKNVNGTDHGDGTFTLEDTIV